MNIIISNSNGICHLIVLPENLTKLRPRLVGSFSFHGPL